MKIYSDVCAVVVTFNFQSAELLKLLMALFLQVDKIIVVDNGSTNALELYSLTKEQTKAHILFLSDNLGIAAAQNKGIHFALDEGFDYVILFDQDSIPSEGMVETLRREYERLRNSGELVAAVGPRLFDPRLECYLPFYTFAMGRYVPVVMDFASPVVRTPILISSGLLFHRDVFKDVGPMDDSLFIDHVDHEWGFRAQSKGYSLYGVLRAVLTHEIGGEIVLIEGGEFQKHSPIRYYYMFRNSLLLYKRCYVPWEWKRADFRDRRLLLKICMRFIRPRRDNLRMIFFGIFHGLLGKTGNIGQRK